MFNKIFETEPFSFFSTSHFSNKNVFQQRPPNIPSFNLASYNTIGRTIKLYTQNIVPLYFEVNV